MMKGFIFVILLVIVGGVVFFIYKNNISSIPSQNENIEVTLVGTLSKVNPTSEYSFLLKGEQGTTGINSMKVDLQKFNNKKVSITGQYSGTVLYADSITETP